MNPRMVLTLAELINGRSEADMAKAHGLSRQTVHVYVKCIYRLFGVGNRGELIAVLMRDWHRRN